jgi:SAM-dependent methyltransferase
METASAGIDIEALQPRTARRALLRRQRADAARWIDVTTGLLRPEVTARARCCVCRSDAGSVQFTKDGFRFVRCDECGLLYVNPRLNDEETRKLYSEGGRGHFQFHHFYLPSAAYRQQKLYPRRLDAIEARLQGVGRLLDVGSSTGHFLQCAQGRGWECHGVELAEYAARYAQDVLGLASVRCVDLLTCTVDDFGGPVDAVTLWDVIEHVTDPEALMAKVLGLLRPGGMVFLHTPHADCFEATVLGPDTISFAGDFHPVCYTKGSLVRLLRRSGFAVADLFTFGLDVAHIIDTYEQRDETDALQFLRTYGDEMQLAIDAAGRGCYLACYARRPDDS